MILGELLNLSEPLFSHWSLCCSGLGAAAVRKGQRQVIRSLIFRETGQVRGPRRRGSSQDSLGAPAPSEGGPQVGYIAFHRVREKPGNSVVHCVSALITGDPVEN